MVPYILLWLNVSSYMHNLIPNSNIDESDRASSLNQKVEGNIEMKLQYIQ